MKKKKKNTFPRNLSFRPRDSRHAILEILEEAIRRGVLSMNLDGFFFSLLFLIFGKDNLKSREKRFQKLDSNSIGTVVKFRKRRISSFFTTITQLEKF